ncbi:EAL domain-containing protein [Neptuniibacter sp. QD34_54]|uniref:EAL domain-containing protein n=1 Tax=Neptuniibacter sp. QD34_54 TaxID=3398208 RepID=UPI0039F4A422
MDTQLLLLLTTAFLLLVGGITFYLFKVKDDSKARDINYQKALHSLDSIISIGDRRSDLAYLQKCLSEFSLMFNARQVWLNYSHCPDIFLDEDCKALELEHPEILSYVLKNKRDFLKFYPKTSNKNLLSLPIIYNDDIPVIFSLELKERPSREQIVLARSLALAIWQGMRKKHRNKRIHEHEVFLRAATEKGNVGLFDWDLRSNSVKFSDVWLAQLGYMPGEFEHNISEWRSSIHPADLQNAEGYIKNCLAKKYQNLSLDYRLTHKNGHILWMRAQASVFYTDLNEAYRIVGAHIDISAEKKAEEILITERDQAHRLATRNDTILESISDGIVELDAEGKQIFVNKAATAILGYSTDELIGHPIQDTWYRTNSVRESLSESNSSIESTLSTGASLSSDDWFIKDSGDCIPVHRKAAPIITNGVITGAVISFFDISKQIADHRSIKLSAAVYQNTAEGIMITDADNKIVSVNPAFERITGYSSQEVVGLGPELLASELTPRETYTDMWKSISERGSWKGEIVNKRKDGIHFTELLSITTLKDDFGHQYYVGVLNDISQVKQAQEQLTQLANHDRLTGIPNKFFFESLIDHLLPKDMRRKRKSALLYLDLDRFKNINDSMGHEYGDQLIIDCAKRLSSQIRDIDYCARIGGDEFAVFVDDYDNEDEIYTLAERLIKTISAPYNLEGCTSYIGLSVGIAFSPKDGRNLDELKRAADAALYQAKADGRGVYRTYSSEMSDMAKERQELEILLRQAMQEQELKLHYQPQVDITTGKTIGYEALARWEHKEKGYISPAQFIPLAEETGLISDLGKWALNQAAKQLRNWLDTGVETNYIAVNISALQLARTDLVSDVKAAITQYEIPATMLELEITESFLVHDPQKAAVVLSELKELGVRVSIDDFGTGFSSLGYIKDLPCDCIKIDQSFIRSITENESDKSLVKAIIAMSQGLGLGVIAEGVEHVEQVEMLKDLGCQVVQGWYYSKPHPPEYFLPKNKKHPKLFAA